MRLLDEKLSDVKYGDVQVLGTVREKEVMHVVARIGTEVSAGVLMNTVTVISTRKSADGWKLMLTGELEDWRRDLRSQ
jgi:hypothetical protein